MLGKILLLCSSRCCVCLFCSRRVAALLTHSVASAMCVVPPVVELVVSSVLAAWQLYFPTVSRRQCVQRTFVVLPRGGGGERGLLVFCSSLCCACCVLCSCRVAAALTLSARRQCVQRTFVELPGGGRGGRGLPGEPNFIISRDCIINPFG